MCVCMYVSRFVVLWLFVFGILGFLVLGLIIFSLLDTRRWMKSKNTLRLMLIHHRQKPAEMTNNIW
jgi:hypothetical protein